MNPLLGAAIGSILRWALAFGAGWLVQHGIWTQAEAGIYVAGFSLAAVSLGWSLVQKYGARLKLVTALSMYPASETVMEQIVKTGETPSAFAAKTISLPPATEVKPL
jgi:hypothetical protein